MFQKSSYYCSQRILSNAYIVRDVSYYFIVKVCLRQQFAFSGDLDRGRGVYFGPLFSPLNFPLLCILSSSVFSLIIWLQLIKKHNNLSFFSFLHWFFREGLVSFQLLPSWWARVVCIFPKRRKNEGGRRQTFTSCLLEEEPRSCCSIGVCEPCYQKETTS